MFKKSLKNQKIDRRSSPRKRLDAMARVVSKEGNATEKTQNYSLTGLFFKSNFPEKYQPKDSVTVSFKDDTGVSHTHTGEIVRKSREGIGIHYRKNPED